MANHQKGDSSKEGNKKNNKAFETYSYKLSNRHLSDQYHVISDEEM